MAIDLEELERLAKTATPGPWEYGPYPSWDFMFRITGRRKEFLFDTHIAQNGEANAQYITAACNAVPKLIAENRALQERVRELERQRDWLAVFIEDNMDCDACPYFEKVCTPQAPVDCAEWIKQVAKEANDA